MRHLVVCRYTRRPPSRIPALRSGSCRMLVLTCDQGVTALINGNMIGRPEPRGATIYTKLLCMYDMYLPSIYCMYTSTIQVEYRYVLYDNYHTTQ